MRRRERVATVLRYYATVMPQATTMLHYANAFQLLVATVLSAQCTDTRINLVTPALFHRYPDAISMAHATPATLYTLISSVSYPHAKARHLCALAQTLVERYDGMVPDDSTALESLPGVGRKTANVVRAVCFNAPLLAVDTHVFRVAHRLGLVSTDANTPAKVEQALYKYIPREQRSAAHHWLIHHGRTLCHSRRPQCAICPFLSFCPTAP